MAKGSTFPTDDVPDRTADIVAVLRRHDPVPVPTTALYLAIEDKRALADNFARAEAEGLIERVQVAPDDERFDATWALTETEPEVRVPLGAYRLTDAGRA